ncbi:MAG: TRAP transporter small permease, partial [Deltaproteobacteria bacterium]
MRVSEKFRRTTYLMGMGGMLLLIPMMVLTTCDVIARAFWHKPIMGTMELSSYMLVLFVFSGLAYTQQVKGHVRVTFLVSRLGKRWRCLLEAMAYLLCLFITAVLVWQGWAVGVQERTVSDMLRIPQRPFRLFLPPAALLLATEFLFDLVGALRGLRGRK